MPIICAAIYSIISTIVIARTVGGIPGEHYSDFTPDYPGGSLGFGWLITNTLIWIIAVSLI